MTNTLKPGQWPSNPDELKWMESVAARYLGADYAYLTPDVVSRVCEGWALRDSPENDRARIETRLRSVASDLRKAEKRRSIRQTASAIRDGDHTADELWWIELDDALSRLDDADEVKKIVELVVSGYSIAAISRRIGKNRYWIMKKLEPVGSILRPEE